jgi:hypothetical protein
MTTSTYNPPASLAGFLTCEKFIALVSGPVGSGKSSASMVKIAYHAKRMKKQKDGIRRSRAVIVRNTAEMLRDSTLPTFNAWFPDGIAGLHAKTEKKFFMKFDDVECEVLFRGLDDANDVRRLLSLEVSFGVLDEYREIHPDIFNALQGRVGRYPSMKDGGCVTDDGTPNYHLWGATNAPDADTFWEDYMENPPSTAAIFKQPSARSPEADWLDYLIPGYYDNLAEGKSEDWISVYIDNEFGKSLSGKPVFRSFNKDVHVAAQALVPNRMSTNPIIVGFDCTGLGPAAVIGQLGFEGRLLIYDELAAVDMGALRFIREVLKPMLINKYANMAVLTVIDPAGMARGADERNVMDMLKAEQMKVIPAKTNGISARIAAVEQFLTRYVDAKPGIVIDPSCVQLVEAFRSKYRFKIDTKGKVADTPEKIRPFADLMDSLQYLCLHADGGAIFGGAVGNTAKREVTKAPHRWCP